MKLIKTKEDVDSLTGGEFFLIQCPKTKMIHKVTPNANALRNTFYRVTQSRGPAYMTNDAYARRTNADGRYHFTTSELKRLIESKTFTIGR